MPSLPSHYKAGPDVDNVCDVTSYNATKLRYMQLVTSLYLLKHCASCKI